MAVKYGYRRRNFWRSVATLLAAVVVFCTTYALILPAITMEKTATCGQEEHVHTQSCYGSRTSYVCGIHQHSDTCRDTEGNLICAVADFCVHSHDASCLADNGELQCSLPEIVAHTHTAECMAAQTEIHHHSEDCTELVRGAQICELEEVSGHTHDDSCREQTVIQICPLQEEAGHTHGTGCYEDTVTLVCTEPESEEHTHSDECRVTESVLTCTLAETPGHSHGEACVEVQETLTCTLEETEGHAHCDECFLWSEAYTCGLEEGQEIQGEPVLACGQEEILLHTHGDSCLDDQGNRICGMLQLEVHIHSESCLAEEEILLCGMEEHSHDAVLCYIDNMADLETEEQWKKTLPGSLTGIWAEDLLAVAESQVGYTESERNLQADAEGFLRGYTRYGAWYGSPYSDWNSIFVSFCLNYANISREAFAYESNAQRWITVLTAREQYKAAADYVPVPGDLVFMDLNDDDIADAAVIVKNLEGNRLTVIQGDTENRAVERITYLLSEVPVESEEKVLLPGDILGYGILPVNPNPDGEEETESTDDVTESMEISQQVQTVAGLIDALPDAETIENTQAQYEAAGDAAGLDAWHEELRGQVTEAYRQYEALNDDEKAAVENADKLLALEYIWSQETLEEPVEEEDDTVHDEFSISGQYWHSPAYKYYQVSGQRLTQSDVMTFPLIPGDQYSEDWTPSTVNWSAKTNANYIVTYCAECMVTVSGSGAAYGSFGIDNSRFMSSGLRKQIAGVIAHSYPYLTLAEMQQELRSAYENGEISVDASACSASEYMTATQAALWQMLLPTMDFSTFAEDTQSFGDTFRAITVNPLEDAGHNTHCLAIKEWLMKQIVPDDLEVADYTYAVENSAYDLYKLQVEGTFNRPVIAGEMVSMQLVAGDRFTEPAYLEAGSDGFTVALTGLTEEEMLEALVSLDISGTRMQAYYFENDSYQDMVGGQWEYYADDLSFRVTKDSTSVSVTKHWAEGSPDSAEAVEVQLYANGSPVQEPVKLDASNNWSYTWPALNKYDALDNPLVYTVRETPVPGYYSTVTAVKGEETTVTVWQEANGFSDGHRYMLVSELGGLSAYYQSGENRRLAWIGADPADPGNCADSLVWTAEAAENGEFYLYNAAVDAKLGYYDLLAKIYYRVAPKPETKSDKWMTFLFANGHLTGRYLEYENLDFSYIGTNSGISGCGYFRDYSGMDYSYALDFTLYELTQKQVPPAEISFVITNTKILEETPLINVSVTKEWAGREDETYPETAQVQLLQNGREYGVSVELGQENDWTYTWTALPQTDNDGVPFVYTVEELDHENYTPEQTGTMGADGIYAILLTNTWDPETVTVKLQKADRITNHLLSGAEFELYVTTNDVGDSLPGTEDVKGTLVQTFTVPDEGAVELELVPGETYYLVETIPPEGYLPLFEPVGFTVTKRGTLVTLTLLNADGWALAEEGTEAVLTVLNRPSYELPETGGAGTHLYTMGGLLLMVSAGILLVYNHKRRRREGY